MITNSVVPMPNEASASANGVLGNCPCATAPSYALLMGWRGRANYSNMRRAPAPSSMALLPTTERQAPHTNVAVAKLLTKI
jgi:hypothetical protein